GPARRLLDERVECGSVETLRKPGEGIPPDASLPRVIEHEPVGDSELASSAFEGRIPLSNGLTKRITVERGRDHVHGAPRQQRLRPRVRCDELIQRTALEADKVRAHELAESGKRRATAEEVHRVAYPLPATIGERLPVNG